MNDENDLKKMMLFGVTKMDIDERNERPMPVQEEKAALNEFSQAEFTDTITFSIIREKDLTKLFSRGALNRFLHIIRLFVGGRMLGFFNRNKKCPEVAVVHLHMEFISKEEYERRAKQSPPV